MMKRMAMALASCLALAACGGDSGGNAAVGKSFTYASATPYSTSSLDYQLSGTLAVGSAAEATSSAVVGNADGLTSSLLGSSSIGLATTPAQRNALATGARAAVRQLMAASAGEFSYQFDNPGCVTTTATSVTMNGCTVTSSYTGSGYSETSKVQVDGSLSYDPTKGTVTWGFTVRDGMSFSYSGQSGSATAALHESGTLTVTATTIQGQMLAEANVSGSTPQASVSLAVSESVDIDVTYADAATCPTRVTGGTLEAKRVWTDRGGMPVSELPDEAAMVTWTGCGQGSIQFSK
jgi:hypothetical protein